MKKLFTAFALIVCLLANTTSAFAEENFTSTIVGEEFKYEEYEEIPQNHNGIYSRNDFIEYSESKRKAFEFKIFILGLIVGGFAIYKLISSNRRRDRELDIKEDANANDAEANRIKLLEYELKLQKYECPKPNSNSK